MNTLLPQAGSLILPGISVLIVLLLAQLLKSVRALPVEGEPLMTGVERQTIAYLEQAVPEARVHAQVCMAAIIRPKRGLSSRERLATRGRFSQKMIDYVLEDRTHNAVGDAKRNAITRAAGYLTIRLPATRRPSAISVREAVHRALSNSRQQHATTTTRRARPA